MYVLILAIMVNTNVSVTTAEFESHTACLKAISSALELESAKDEMKIKARCVSK